MMITSVFLSNNTVFIACGAEGKRLSGRARSIIYRMPEGSLLNGMITNEQELTEQLRELWQKEGLPKKNVRLVLESSHFSVKTLELPHMKKAEISGVIQREFAEMEQYEEKLYDYAVLHEMENGAQEALAVMVNRSYIESWKNIFGSIGITLERITVSRETMTRYFASCRELRQGAYVLLLLDDMILTSVLWINGRLISADRKRMFSEAGSEEFYTEIARSVSSIRQFYVGQKAKGKLEEVYLCGFRDEDTGRCQESLNGFDLNMRVQPLRASYADNVMAAGGLLQTKKTVNMLEALKVQKKADKSLKISAKRAVPLIVLIIVCIVATLGLMAACSMRMAKATKLSEYLSDPENLRKKYTVEALNSEVGNMTRMLRESEQVKEMKESYPLADSKVTDKILAVAGYDISVRVESYSASAGEIRLTISTPVVENVNQYISSLRNTGMFVDVDYVGYGYSEVDGRYQVQVSCILKGNAGK
ncbi:MAG: hypothetical protein HDQ96_11825 [Lachnospiraceae bacterium]|nr:hypothetical protein [Lachnospiraceae bacterium]